MTLTQIDYDILMEKFRVFEEKLDNLQKEVNELKLKPKGHEYFEWPFSEYIIHKENK